MEEKIWLSVPYVEKDEAKNLGARWNPSHKKWYILNSQDVSVFKKWIPNKKEEISTNITLIPTTYLLQSNQICWKCKDSTEVIALGALNFREKKGNLFKETSNKYPIYSLDELEAKYNRLVIPFFIQQMPALLSERLHQKFPNYYKGYSQTANINYYMNHCSSCGAIQGDNHLHGNLGAFAIERLNIEDGIKFQRLFLSIEIAIKANSMTHYYNDDKYSEYYFKLTANPLDNGLEKEFLQKLLSDDKKVLKIINSFNYPIVNESDNYLGNILEIAFEGQQDFRIWIDSINYYLKFDKNLFYKTKWLFENYSNGKFNDFTKALTYYNQIENFGEKIFRSIFHSNIIANRLWQQLEYQLEDIDVKVMDKETNLFTIPWEFINVPEIGPLIMKSKSFVRMLEKDKWNEEISYKNKKIKMLYFISRSKIDDISYDALYSYLIDVFDSSTDKFEITLCKTGKYEDFNKLLVDAQESDSPYDLVHFDGHGGYDLGLFPNNSYYKHNGCIVFDSRDGEDLKLGQEVGKLLSDNNVKWLVLNSCRSAMSYSATPSESSVYDSTTHKEVMGLSDELYNKWIKNHLNTEQTLNSLSNIKINAGGSFASETMNAGVKNGLVAMNYNLPVETAQRYFNDFYTYIMNGYSIPEAACYARRDLLNYFWDRGGWILEKNAIELYFPIIYSRDSISF